MGVSGVPPAEEEVEAALEAARPRVPRVTRRAAAATASSSVSSSEAQPSLAPPSPRVDLLTVAAEEVGAGLVPPCPPPPPLLPTDVASPSAEVIEVVEEGMGVMAGEAGTGKMDCSKSISCSRKPATGNTYARMGNISC